MYKGKTLNRNPASRSGLATLMLAVFLLVGCQGQDMLQSILPQEVDEAESITMTPMPTASIAATPPLSPTSPDFYNLVLWVPPQFDPNADTEAGRLLSARITEFLQQNPAVNLDVRVKAASGPGSILDTLTNAAGVAPDALPSLVLISRTELVQAVEKNLLYPVENASSAIDDSDWYGFAQEMGILMGTVYGLPFASDTISLVYRGEALDQNAPDWDDVYRAFDSLTFPAGDPDALISLALYTSGGGGFTSQQNSQQINPDILARLLDVYATGVQQGVIPVNASELQTDDQSWEYFKSGESEAVITWAHRQTAKDESLNLALLPSLGEAPYTFAGGWLWCLTDPNEANHPLAAALAEYLVDAGFLAEWAPVSGYLPVRPSSLEKWEEPQIRDTLSSMLLSAHLRPQRPTVNLISAEIKTAVQEIITGQSNPQESAQRVFERLEAVDIP